MEKLTSKELIFRWIHWKEQKDDRRYKQKEIAELAGFSERHMSGVMNNPHLVGLRTLMVLANNVFGVTYEEFLEGPEVYENKRKGLGIPVGGGSS